MINDRYQKTAQSKRKKKKENWSLQTAGSEVNLTKKWYNK